MKRHHFVFTLALALAGASGPTPAWADDGHGHDHGGAPIPASNGPRRLPDGSVFLPKPAQRQIGVRTLVGEPAELPRAVELNGRVEMDPNAGGKVQAMVPGRIVPGPQGLPAVGRRVARGEVLAYVVPAAGAIERAGQTARIAELKAAQALAERRLARLRELADTVPRKEIEAAEAERASLAAQTAALGAGLQARDALAAPVSGVVASAHVVAGQVVDVRELAFEIVDPERLRIEALAFDPALAAGIGGAELAVDGASVPLAFVGAARSLRDQALPLSFQAEGPALAQLAVGQPVKVVVQTRERRRGVPLPAAALMKDPANQTIVWVKTAPERFEPRTVLVEPLGGTSVLVTSGLAGGDRVVVQGATLVNQVR